MIICTHLFLCSQFKKPSASVGEKNLYMQAPPFLQESTKGNLPKPLAEFVTTGDEIAVSDPTLPDVILTVTIVFKI
jgi:ubiquitin-activating enzyme E1 C